jgi:Protein of unknown function (DUF1186)
MDYDNSDRMEIIDHKEPGMDERITEVLDGIKIFNGKYKRDMVDQAVELKNDITPHLIKILETVRDNPESYLESDVYYDHNYALMLLGHFKEPTAHDVIVDIFNLPDEIPDRLFGEIVTEDLPAILLRTCDGSLDRVKELILNKGADDYCRISAVQALAHSVVEGFETREAVLSFLCKLFTGTEATSVSDFWSFLAMNVQSLYPDVCMETINKAYEDGLISPGLIRYESFDRTLKAGKEKCLENLKGISNYLSLDDIHKSMSWWACFDNDEPEPFDTALEPAAFNPVKPIKKQEKKKKKKRKMAKKSKRKNRS